MIVCKKLELLEYLSLILFVYKGYKIQMEFWVRTWDCDSTNQKKSIVFEKSR